MVFQKAKWIIPADLASINPVDVFHKEQDKKEIELPENLKNLHIFYQKEFSWQPCGENVRLRVTADDYYKLYLNGELVGMGPAQGYYFDYYWNEYDITDMLSQGKNTITADVYYHGLISRSFNSGDRRIGFIAEIQCGNRVLEATDENWQFQYARCYKGKEILGYDTAFKENFDSRLLEFHGEPALAIQTDHVFHHEPIKPVQFYSVSPIITETLPNGAIFLDFGTELTGHLCITAEGKAGQKIRILHGEEADDNLPFKTRFDMRCNCVYDETWTLAEGLNTREQYDYKAFRYVTLVPDQGIIIKSVTATVRHYPFRDDYCNLETGNKKLKAVWQICKNSIKYGSQETFVDCPQREKGQYAGDLTVTSAAHLILTHDLSLLRKAIDNQMQSAFVCEGLLAVTPGSLMQEIADYSLQFPILALRYYRYSGDREYLKSTLKTCEKMLKHFETFARDDGLLCSVTDKWNLVDWPENMRDGYDFPLANPMPPGSGCHNVLNAFYIGAVLCTEEIRSILGIDGVKKSENLIYSFNRAFFNPETGLYIDSENTSHSALHSNVLPVYFGFNPPESNGTIGDFIVNRGLSCGVYMAYFVLKALCRLGRYDDAFELIISEGQNSWMNMIREGATTCFEVWGKEQKWNTSLCHPWASAPITVLAEDILPNRPQYGRIVYSD